MPDVPLPEQTTITYTYTSDNRLETCNGQSVSYDADGNMTSGPLNGQTASFTFDFHNRLTVAGGTATEPPVLMGGSVGHSKIEFLTL